MTSFLVLDTLMFNELKNPSSKWNLFLYSVKSGYLLYTYGHPGDPSTMAGMFTSGYTAKQLSKLFFSKLIGNF
jgi:hypothetical protein